MNRITVEHEATMANLKRKHEETFEGFKKNTLGMLSDVTTELKSNILLHTQLGFDVRFSSGAAWDEFTAKWKNSMDFYLEESPSEPPVVPAGDYTTSNPAVENAKVTERKGRDNEARGNLDERLKFNYLYFCNFEFSLFMNERIEV
ncbi:hypothetical protein PVK06_041307 [Gossypium arboreum]|uniref:Uncharacterized protein n=1 Tax=Gossypium arboreum TaxID=29729 RepID=A0ABR0N7V2_GOSAR|nr:hypothetical protein PVK06_041307 [Gossypium arboreum]